jgi:hypothetical protein
MDMLGIRRCREEEEMSMRAKKSQVGICCLVIDAKPNALPLPELFEDLEMAAAARASRGHREI